MADFGVEFVGNDPDAMARKLKATATSGRRRTNNALRQTAEDIKKDIEDTAPVDSGAYKSSWYVQPISEEEVWVLSASDEAPHNQYLMLPNENFVGSSRADRPASGVYHDVVAVAQNHQKNFRGNLAQQIQNLIDSLRVR